MPAETPVYELTLLLSTDASEDARARILAEVETAIERGGGSLVRKTALGTRNLAYRINRRVDAEYHLFELTGSASLLRDLGHSLGITDGVLRFRIIKAIPGTGRATRRQPGGTTERVQSASA